MILRNIVRSVHAADIGADISSLLELINRLQLSQTFDIIFVKMVFLDIYTFYTYECMIWSD